MPQELTEILEAETIEASAPCRIDMGGTLDISTFYYPLRHLAPCTFNIAMGLRTHVRLSPYHKNRIRISSKGFKSAEFCASQAPFNHPLGLMFAIPVYFNVQNVQIDIESQSPPRSALGGSSAAAVALIAAFSKLLERANLEESLTRPQIATVAHALEESVAGVPCGFQDQLAAIYGGVNVWMCPSRVEKPQFRKKTVLSKRWHKGLEKHLLLAYCGRPHASSNINGKWIQQFLSGKFRDLWVEIIACTHKFVDALSYRNYIEAAALMNKETTIRSKMTPDVLDYTGTKLVKTAIEQNCGARFTGAGGGGCIWALGEVESIDRLRPIWEKLLSPEDEGCLLDTTIDSTGLIVH
jgi:D-glycero-alpha-D-manno-heptose-7-phosphate kinase